MGAESTVSVTELTATIDRFAGLRVAVLGDIAADEYIIGRPARISREAPVLILEFTESFLRPGGAANTAANLARLGARAAMIGAVGADEMGHDLRDMLAADGIDVSAIVTEPSRPTARKTRILARGTQEVRQQIVRIDRVDTGEMSPASREQLANGACEIMRECDALIISDYESGVMSPQIIDVCVPEARRLGLKIIVDSHGDLLRFKGVTAATPNQPEAGATLGRTLRTDEDVDRAGLELVQAMDAQSVLITRGSEGMALYERGREPFKLSVTLSDGTEAVDPNGAGDTVAAVFALAISAGASHRTAAILGNVAGGDVVRRLGAVTLTPAELLQAVQRSYG